MIEPDTVRLLRECDAGITMGISSIEDVIDYAKDQQLRRILSECRRDHMELQQQLQKLLERYGDDGKAPNPIAKGMSRLKTNMKLGMESSDAVIADLITDGCGMGVKSLSKYLNQYKAADQESKEIAKKLIALEEGLEVDIRKYL